MQLNGYWLRIVYTEAFKYIKTARYILLLSVIKVGKGYPIYCQLNQSVKEQLCTTCQWSA
ncbi:hypothetical protein GCM10009128_18040 [Psychrosphaera haliotis]